MRRHAPSAALLAVLLLAAPGLALADSSHSHWHWGGDAVTGDGHKVSQPREVKPFSAVRLEGSLDVRVTVGPARAVSVLIDENLQPLVETRVEGDTLVIELGSSED